MNKPLSPKQAATLEAINEFIRTNGYSPTTRELAVALGYKSSSTVHALLDRLAAKGYISKESGGPRTIRVLKDELESTKEALLDRFTRMEAALRNILEISNDDFAKHQARYGLGIDK